MKLRTWCIRSGQILTKPVLVFAGFLVFLTIFNPATIQAENGRGGITIRHENVPIQTVFQTIEKQSGYRFFYNETLLQGAIKVTLHLQNVSLQEALDACFRNQPLSYAIVDKTIIVKRRPEQQPVAPIPTAVSFTTPNKGKLIAVRGKVTSNNVPVAGASIMIKGTDNGASTDKDGIFTLSEVDEEAILVVSSVSHEAREVRLNGQGFITIDLAKQADDLDEAVVVAYNTTTKRMNTGAVSVVKGEDVQNLPSRSVDKSLQGLVPGLLVTSGTGQPGGGVSNFVLRGIATGGVPTGGSTVRNPLIVIDGVPVSQDHTQWGLTTGAETPVINPMAQLNPADIESISVLKDAAAIALYGSKASNGVILITTKRGSSGKTNFSFQQQTDIASRLNGKLELLNQQEYLDLIYETYRNTNAAFWTDVRIDSVLKKNFITKADGSFYPEADWAGALYNNKATTLSNNLSVSGGNGKSNFYLNFEYTKQDGVVKKTGYDRKSIRFNFENRPTNWLKLGINSTFSYNIQDYATLSSSSFPLSIATLTSPLIPIYLEDGSYNFNFSVIGQGANPVAEREYNSKRNVGYRGLNKIYGEINFLKDFRFTSQLGLDFLLMESREKIDPRLYDADTRSVGSGRIQEKETRNANLINTNTLRFDKSIGKFHSLNLLAGQEAQIYSQKYLMVTASGFKLSYFDQVNNGATRNAEGGNNKQTLVSYFGQANYGFKNKYLLSASIRKDGSSKFGDRERFGTYWSTGAGWIVSEESFAKQFHWLDYLKIRSSLGAAGNSGAIDKYTRYDILQTGTFLNSSNMAIFPGTNPANPDIRWEKTFTWDAGIEARLWKQRISVTADVYKRKTSDVIYSANLPLSSGYTTVLDNIGVIDNKGVELSLSVDIIRNNNWRWRMTANWSTNQNKLIKADVPLASIAGNTLGNEEGRNFNSFYMPRWGGVNPDNGLGQWIDSTGKLNTNFDAAKKEFVGKPQPDGFGSINNTVSYKNLELSALLYYQYGFMVYVPNNLNNDGNSPFLNQEKSALNRWKAPNDIALNPKRTLNNANGSQISTRNLFNGDYIRLQNVILSYRLSNGVCKRLGVNSIRMFAQGHNLALFTGFKSDNDLGNIDVRGSSSTSIYPEQRSFSFGINLSL